MLPLITTKIKDDILQWLCLNIPLGSSSDIDIADIQETVSVDIDQDTVEAILEDFEELGLVKELNVGRFGTEVTLRLPAKAHSFLQQGGFAVEDALNEANIQKILLELENLQKQLKPDQVEVFNKLTSIASSIAAVYTAFTDK